MALAVVVLGLGGGWRAEASTRGHTATGSYEGPPTGAWIDFDSPALHQGIVGGAASVDCVVYVKGWSDCGEFSAVAASGESRVHVAFVDRSGRSVTGQVSLSEKSNSYPLSSNKTYEVCGAIDLPVKAGERVSAQPAFGIGPACSSPTGGTIVATFHS